VGASEHHTALHSKKGCASHQANLKDNKEFHPTEKKLGRLREGCFTTTEDPVHRDVCSEVYTTFREREEEMRKERGVRNGRLG
jgi:hypothetical protein